MNAIPSPIGGGSWGGGLTTIWKSRLGTAEIGSRWPYRYFCHRGRASAKFVQFYARLQDHVVELFLVAAHPFKIPYKLGFSAEERR